MPAPAGPAPLASPLVPAATVSLAEASRFWLHLGLVSFGGPAGQIAMLHRELVDQRRWISEARFLHALNYCQLLPGPEAIQLATYLGWLLHGTRGGLIAGGLFLLPSVLLLLLLSSIYALWGRLPLLGGIFWALKPAVLAIVIQACWRLGRRTLKGPLQVVIAAAALVGLQGLGLPQPLLIALAALSGWIAERLRPGILVSAAGHSPRSSQASAPAQAAQHPQEPQASSKATAPARPAAGLDALHGDATATPPHARIRPRQLALTLLAGGLAVALPLVALTVVDGWNGTLTTMARFFSRVALVSFGGAYAVLPYVAQGAVERFGWLSAAQMVDGLALGETTPGPLIIVVAFVGVLGGWHAAGSLAYALVAGLVVVWFTFLPSFLFILVGGPLVEASRGEARLAGPMQAIGAAVVGMVASLALLFAGPVLWPGSPGAGLDLAAVALLALALLLLFWRRWGVLPLIGGAALVGLARVGLVWLGS
ncbi:MAG: chromate transporter [Cyanobacteria bacterium]|nr:chromate transporter [Cyanobacteriota bacterium]